MKFEKIRIPADEISRAPLKRSSQIFVIVRIFLNCPDFQTTFGGFGNQCQGYNPTITLHICQRKISAHLWIFQTAPNFIEDGIGAHKLKRLVVQQQTKNASRRSLRANTSADINIGIKDGSNHALLSPGPASPMFGFVGKLVGPALRYSFRPPIKNRQQVQTRRLLHLFESLDRNHRCQRLSLALDDEFIMPKRHPIQKISKPLTDFKRRHRFNHASPHL